MLRARVQKKKEEDSETESGREGKREISNIAETSHVMSVHVRNCTIQTELNIYVVMAS